MKEIRSGIFLLSVGLLVATHCMSAFAQKCLEYGPTVSPTGTLHTRVFAGPPNYESIRRGDRKEWALILTLVKPVCTKRDAVGIENPSYSNIREMQLVVYKDEQWKTVHQRMGKSVVVRGTLFGALTGHHRTKVLIDVKSIRAARPPTR